MLFPQMPTPYSSQEKGSNERDNRLVRRFIAKGKRISDYGLDAIAKINNLPRKIVGQKIPDELFEAKLDEFMQFDQGKCANCSCNLWQNKNEKSVDNFRKALYNKISRK